MDNCHFFTALLHERGVFIIGLPIAPIIDTECMGARKIVVEFFVDLFVVSGGGHEMMVKI